jgi:DNA-binding PadR family transcriptional regulator
MSLHYVLLAALSKRSDTGYGLNRRLRDDLSHVWHARQQQVYRELARLQAEGLVDLRRVPQENRPDKKVYSPTRAGAEQLDAWLTGSIPPPEAKNERFLKLYCIERLPKEAMERVLTARLEQWERLRDELRSKLERTDAADPGELGYRLTLTAALAEAEAKTASCAALLAMLQSADDPEPRPIGSDSEAFQPAGLARAPH